MREDHRQRRVFRGASRRPGIGRATNLLDVQGDTVVGDDAVLFGPGDNGEPTADDWAAAIGTINYEIVTRVGARVPRVYLGEAP